MPVPRVAGVGDPTGGHFKGGEQCRGAVPDPRLHRTSVLRQDDAHRADRGAQQHRRHRRASYPAPTGWPAAGVILRDGAAQVRRRSQAR